MQEIEMVKEFLSSPEHRAKWLNGPELNIYVRKGSRSIQNRQIFCLQIANIEVHLPGTGVFTRFLTELEIINPYEAIYIENVLTKRFQNYFLKRNYVKIVGTFPVCFYKLAGPTDIKLER